jgi:hypothetical protein
LLRVFRDQNEKLLRRFSYKSSKRDPIVNMRAFARLSRHCAVKLKVIRLHRECTLTPTLGLYIEKRIEFREFPAAQGRKRDTS